MVYLTGGQPMIEDSAEVFILLVAMYDSKQAEAHEFTRGSERQSGGG